RCGPQDAARSGVVRPDSGTRTHGVLLPRLPPPPAQAWLDQTAYHGHRHDTDDHAQRRPDTDLAHVQTVLLQRAHEHLDSDEPHDGGHTPTDGGQSIHQAGQQEVQLPQPHQRKGVGGEDDVDVLGQTEDRRDGVHRKDQIDHPDRQDDQQHRGDVPTAGQPHGQPGAVVVVGHRPKTPDQAYHRGLSEVLFLLITLHVVTDDLVGRVDEEGTEEVEDLAPGVDDLGAQDDEDPAHHDRDHDTGEQDLVLVLLGYRKSADQQVEDEEVVDAQAFLGDEPGEVLDPGLSATEEHDRKTEQYGDGDVEDRPPGRLADPEIPRTLVLVPRTVDDEQIKDQDHD